MNRYPATCTVMAATCPMLIGRTGPCRSAVRAQLRGGWRENNILHGDAASEAFLVDVSAPRLGRPAPCQCRKHVRIWRRAASGGCIALYRSRSAGHRLWRCNGPDARSGAARRHAGSRLGNRLAWPKMGPAQGHAARRRARPDRRGHPPPHPRDRHPPSSDGTPAAPRSIPWSLSPMPAASPTSPTPMTTPAVLESDPRQAAADNPLFPLDQRHALRHGPGFDNGEEYFQFLRDSFDCLYAEGEAGSPKMMSLGLHCRLIGQPAASRASRSSWITSGHSTGSGYRPASTSPATGLSIIPMSAPEVLPSQLAKDEFVKRYGSIFEHSHWIAERAWRSELGPVNDTAVGLHSPCAHNSAPRLPKSASPSSALTPILRQAGRCQAPSPPTLTAEQASAGSTP